MATMTAPMMTLATMVLSRRDGDSWAMLKTVIADEPMVINHLRGGQQRLERASHLAPGSAVNLRAGTCTFEVELLEVAPLDDSGNIWVRFAEQ